MNPGVISRYRERLPVGPATPVITLLEGATPLIPAPNLAKDIGLPEDSLYLKYEGLNPTGSFKDRGMTLAASKAVEEGSRGFVCASTGNTAASAAAYAARAGLPCLVLLPAGGVAAGKLAQALMYGAQVVAVKGSFDAALKLVKEAAPELGLTVVNSLNPFRIEGQKTAAFEIVEQLGRAPDYQFMPVGNAGNITAYWKGYTQFGAGRPKMMGFQAAGSAPLVSGRPVKIPKTIASAIRIGNPAAWKTAIEARDESEGMIGSVTDAEILAAYRLIARMEGVFCEPSSAAGVAGLIKLLKTKKLSVPTGTRIACILTGNGLKDPDAPHTLKLKWKTIRPDLKSLRAAVGKRK